MSNIETILAARAAQEIKDGVPAFLVFPERWLERPRWRCENGHVSTCVLKSEVRGTLCLACHEKVVLTFPEDVDGEL
jgi:hypothetical protein